MRLFFAVLLPEEIVARATDVQRQLREWITDSGVKWTQPEQFHFTVKFLGDIPPEKIEKVLQTGQAVREGRDRFELAVEGAGAFPSASRPSTLWLGVTTGADSLAEIALQLDGILVKYGHKKENRPPTPHLTLARIRTYSGEAQAAGALKRADIGEIGSYTVDRFVLMRSTPRYYRDRLKPTGSEYSVVEEFPFNK